MLVRYFIEHETDVLPETSHAERVAHLRRVETISTLTGGLILLAMLATLLVVQGA